MPVGKFQHDNRNLTKIAQMFTDDYREKCFDVWYNNGRPNVHELLEILKSNIGPDPVHGKFPNPSTLGSWKKNFWMDRCAILDEQVTRQMDVVLVEQRVEMLRRHSEIGKTMQTRALEYLEEHGLGNSRNAITLLVEGLRTERESVGVIPYFEKLVDMSDDKLMDELKKLVTSTPAELLPNNDE